VSLVAQIKGMRAIIPRTDIRRHTALQAASNISRRHKKRFSESLVLAERRGVFLLQAEIWKI